MSDFDVSLTPAAAINVTVSGGVGPAGPAGAGGVATLQGLAGALTLAAVGGTWAVAGSTITLTVTAAGAVAWADITGKPATFAPSAHSHAIADTTGLQAALDAKAPLASPTFTGTVSGVTKAMVGLSAVDNVADASKPVSTAQAAANAAVQAHAIQRANHTGTQAVGTITGLATVATTGAYADLSGAPAAYSLPTATASVLGGVKIGSGLSIDGSGVVTAAGTYTLPAATVSALGGVIVGTGLAVSSGTISVSYGTSSSTACVGNDARLSDARTPTAHTQAFSTITSTPTTLTGYGITDAATSTHTHGNITNAGAIGSTSGQIVVTTTSGVLTTAASISASAVSGLAAAATSGSASDLTGTLADARLSDRVNSILTLSQWSSAR